MRRLAPIVVAACGGAAPRAVPPAPKPVAPTALVFRQIQITASHANRTTFELTLEGDRATLVETEDRAFDPVSWTVVSNRTYRGTRRGSELELKTDDMQPLALHCESRSLGVAVAPEPGDECNADPPAVTRHVDALVCTAAGQSVADADADDQLVFAPAPGVEWLDTACGGSLRQPRS
jgi:hypothetical protein